MSLKGTRGSTDNSEAAHRTPKETVMHMQRIMERNEELERLRQRYAGRGKTGKGRLLHESCQYRDYRTEGSRASAVAARNKVAITVKTTAREVGATGAKP
jgi:hypothetical protein